MSGFFTKKFWELRSQVTDMSRLDQMDIKAKLSLSFEVEVEAELGSDLLRNDIENEWRVCYSWCEHV